MIDKWCGIIYNEYRTEGKRRGKAVTTTLPLRRPQLKQKDIMQIKIQTYTTRAERVKSEKLDKYIYFLAGLCICLSLLVL